MTNRGLTITITDEYSGNSYTAQGRTASIGRIPRVFGGQFKMMMTAAAAGVARRAFVKWHDGETDDA